MWRFNGSLEEELYGKDFEIGNTAPTYGNLDIFDFSQSKNVTRRGLEFVDGVTFSAGTDFDFSVDEYEVVVSFWWYSPGAVGQTRHAITRRLVPKMAPIVAKANSSISDGVETISRGEWIISEIGVSSTRNAIQLAVCENGLGPTHVFESASYLPGLHHVAFIYRRNSYGKDFIILSIDGKPGTHEMGPATITPVGTSALRINDIGFGYTAHRSEQAGGIIADLVLLNTSNSESTSWPLTVMRFGLEYIADADKIGSIPSFNAFVFQQPSTITTKQIFKVGENIIAARSNGELLSGARPIWDTVLGFKTPQDVDKLITSETDDCPIGRPDETKKTVCWTENGLRVQGATIRI